MSQEDAPLAYDTSVCLHLEDAAPVPFSFGAGDPTTVRPLRRLDDWSLRSGVLQLEAGWSSGSALRARTTTQLMVLDGRLQLGERVLQANAFVAVPAGGALPLLTALAPSRVMLIQDAGAAYSPVADGDDAIVHPDVLAIEPIIPVIAGRKLDGFERRTLWLDPASGADTRLLRVPAGFQGAGPNWHPVNEEIFCLAGDIAPDDSRPMRPGSFLWNPARSIHGFNERTVGGCVLLEWHDGPWALTLA